MDFSLQYTQVGRKCRRLGSGYQYYLCTYSGPRKYRNQFHCKLILIIINADYNVFPGLKPIGMYMLGW